MRGLNQRLLALSAFIHDNESIIDVGCDHGLLGIYLCLNRNNINVISSDIKKKPLDMALANTYKYHLEKQIKIKLGDGLSTIEDNTKTVVISGMGGISIVNILKDIEKYPHVQKLVLSPNNDFSYMRGMVNKLGYEIVQEKLIYERKKYYLISEWQKGTKECNSFFGRLNLNDETVRNYYFEKRKQNDKILENLKDITRRKKLMMENCQIEEKFSF